MKTSTDLTNSVILTVPSYMRKTLTSETANDLYHTFLFYPTNTVWFSTTLKVNNVYNRLFTASYFNYLCWLACVSFSWMLNITDAYSVTVKHSKIAFVSTPFMYTTLLLFPLGGCLSPPPTALEGSWSRSIGLCPCWLCEWWHHLFCKGIRKFSPEIRKKLCISFRIRWEDEYSSGFPMYK